MTDTSSEEHARARHARASQVTLVRRRKAGPWEEVVPDVDTK